MNRPFGHRRRNTIRLTIVGTRWVVKGAGFVAVRRWDCLHKSNGAAGSDISGLANRPICTSFEYSSSKPEVVDIRTYSLKILSDQLSCDPCNWVLCRCCHIIIIIIIITKDINESRAVYTRQWHLTAKNKSVFSYLRTLTTWHCPHSPAARRCCSSRSISPPAHRCRSAVVSQYWDRQTNGPTDGHGTVS